MVYCFVEVYTTIYTYQSYIAGLHQVWVSSHHSSGPNTGGYSGGGQIIKKNFSIFSVIHTDTVCLYELCHVSVNIMELWLKQWNIEYST